MILLLRIATFATILVTALPAQSCVQAYDINTTAAPASSDPDRLVPLGAGALFRAETVFLGNTLWFTDGTTGGTRQVAAWNGFEGLEQIGARVPGSPARRLLVADDSASGKELWITDGTITGTRLLKDIRPGARGSDPIRFIELANQVLFLANDRGLGARLWTTDGTTGGTQLFQDINPLGPVGIVDFRVDPGGQGAWLTLDDGQFGFELWRTDGTPNGTRMVRDIRPGRGFSAPNGYWRVNGTTLFSAQDSRGNELWRSDGTAAGTQLVREIRPGPEGSMVNLSDAVVLGNHLYFPATDPAGGTELWRSDGTTSGTTRVADIASGAASSFASDLVRMGSFVLFRASSPTSGSELWITDGSSNGTRIVADLVPGSGSSTPRDLVALDANTVLFHATTSATGDELYRTDGTAQGTVQIADLLPGPRSSRPVAFADRIANSILLAATGPQGRELYRTDGTPSGTRLLKDVDPFRPTFGSAASPPVAANGTLYCAARGSQGRELWQVGRRGQRQVLDINPGVTSSRIGWLTEFFDGRTSRLIFSADDGRSGNEPWITDGTPANTRRLLDIHPGSTQSAPEQFTPIRGQMLFVATDPLGEEPWITDGTNTRRVLDLFPGRNSSAPEHLTRWRDDVVFSALTPGSGRELWRTDGTPSGTRQIADLTPGLGSSDIRSIATFRDSIVLVLREANRDQLVISDGTSASTRRIQSPQLRTVQHLVEFQDRLFFAGTGREGEELWVSDGTDAGTHLFVDLHPFGQGRPSRFAVANNRLFFSANSLSGNELWVSDGTTAGTRGVDIYSGPNSSLPTELTAAGDGIFLTVDLRPAYGRELFYSDGTVQGTRLVCDLRQGLASSRPSRLAVHEQRLTFVADSTAFGQEVHWVATDKATTERTGSSCGPTAPTVYSNAPILGTTLDLRGRVRTNRPAGVALIGSPARGVVPLVGSLPCRLGLDPTRPIAVLTNVTTPSWTHRVVIPAAPSLAGKAAAVQVVVLDAGGQPRLDASPTVRLNLGLR